VVLELVYAPSDERAELAKQLQAKIEDYWPLLTMRVRAAAPPKGAAGRCGRADAFDLLWVERWGASRHSSVLHPPVAQPAGAPLPSLRALLTCVRKKIEGNGILENLALTL